MPRDLTTYFNREILALSELEDVALQRYDALTGDNFISDQALRSGLDETIIPVYGRFTDLVREVTPETKSVRKLHAVYRNAAALRLQGFRMILLAIDTQDPVLIRQANRMLEQGQGLVVQWRSSVMTLADQYGLKLHRE